MPYKSPDVKNKNWAWKAEFTSALNERVREKWPERVRKAEEAIFSRIETLGTRPVSIDDVGERCAMSAALSTLRGFFD